MSSERGGQAAFSSGSKTRTKARGFSEALPDTDIGRLRTGLFSRNYPHVSQITHPQVDIDGKGIDSINPSHLKKQGIPQSIATSLTPLLQKLDMNVSPSTTIRSDERSDERSIKSSKSARTGLSQSQKLSAVRRPVRRSRSSGRKGPGTRNRTYSAKTYSAKTYTPARPSKTTGRHVLIAPWEKPERVTKLSRKVVPAPMRKESVNRKKVIGQKSSRKEIPIRGKMTFGVGKATAPWDRPEISTTMCSFPFSLELCKSFFLKQALSTPKKS